MLTRLPPLLIVVDWSGARIQTLKEESRVAATFRYPNRVYGIAISNLLSDMVYKAMNRPFLILESFKIHGGYRPKLEVPMTIFNGTAPSLRRLQLQNVLFASVSQLLSSTTGLVELDLVCLLPAASLITHLQGMPCLRCLQLRVLNYLSPTTSIPMSPMEATIVVPLLRLTHFQFSGGTTYFEALAGRPIPLGSRDRTQRLLPYVPAPLQVHRRRRRTVFRRSDGCHLKSSPGFHADTIPVHR